MANGLYCEETLASTPKLRHESTDSNSENTPPELLSVLGKHCDLFCNEVLDENKINQTSQKQTHKPQPLRPHQESFNPNPVNSKTDLYLLNDDRVLQNLLRNEERYMPGNPDYFKYVQEEINESMREKVVDWMFGVTKDSLESTLSLDAFASAVNFLDRFLSVCRISVNQFQLLGATCLFLASKFKAFNNIRSETMVEYTDNLYTSRELKEWELLILQKLRWELSSTTALDYLDHVIPRLFLPEAVDIEKFRRQTNTAICLALRDYFFTYKAPSVLAASSILFSLQQCLEQGDFTQPQRQAVEKIIKEARTCLQILTHVGGDDLDQCCLRLRGIPELWEQHHAASSPRQSPDTTVLSEPDQLTSTPAKVQQSSPSSSDVFSGISSTSSLPSAVDVFSDFNSSVLEAVLSPSDSYTLQLTAHSLVT